MPPKKLLPDIIAHLFHILNHYFSGGRAKRFLSYRTAGGDDSITGCRNEFPLFYRTAGGDDSITGCRNAFHEKHASAPFRTQRLLRNFHRKSTRKFQAPAFSKGFSLEMRFLQPFHYFTNRLEEDAFQCKTLKKRRYLDFPSDGFSRWKILSIRYAFCGVRTCLTWNHLRQPSAEFMG